MKIKKDETYGAFIKRVRLTAKMSQEEFALRLGFAPHTISRWENGRNISIYSQRRIDDFAKKIK